MQIAQLVYPDAEPAQTTPVAAPAPTAAPTPAKPVAAAAPVVAKPAEKPTEKPAPKEEKKPVETAKVEVAKPKEEKKVEKPKEVEKVEASEPADAVLDEEAGTLAQICCWSSLERLWPRFNGFATLLRSCTSASRIFGSLTLHFVSSAHNQIELTDIGARHALCGPPSVEL